MESHLSFSRACVWRLDFAPLLVTLGLLYPVAAMIGYVVREKEFRQKELMKMVRALVRYLLLRDSFLSSFLAINISLSALCSPSFYLDR